MPKHTSKPSRYGCRCTSVGPSNGVAVATAGHVFQNANATAEARDDSSPSVSVCFSPRHASCFGLTVDLIVVATLTAIEFWLIYRNLTSDVRTAKIAALSCAGVLAYFVLVNANSQRWDLVAIDTVSVICLGYVFVMLP